MKNTLIVAGLIAVSSAIKIQDAHLYEDHPEHDAEVKTTEMKEVDPDDKHLNHECNAAENMPKEGKGPTFTGEMSDLDHMMEHMHGGEDNQGQLELAQQVDEWANKVVVTKWNQPNNWSTWPTPYYHFTFTNECPFPIAMYWVDYSGNNYDLGWTLSHWTTTWNSYAAHPWNIYNAHTGEFLLNWYVNADHFPAGHEYFFTTRVRQGQFEIQIDTPSTIEASNLLREYANGINPSSYQTLGINYPRPDTAQMDHGSITTDRLRGGHTVFWYDSLNMKHQVQMGRHGQSTITFPITNGEVVWRRQDGGSDRTGFNASVNWLTCNFYGERDSCGWGEFWCQEGDYVKVVCTGYRETDADGGFWGELQDRSYEILAVADKTADVAQKIADVYVTVKGAKGGGKKPAVK